jgi:hypothetical protein
MEEHQHFHRPDDGLAFVIPFGSLRAMMGGNDLTIRGGAESSRTRHWLAEVVHLESLCGYLVQ